MVAKLLGVSDLIARARHSVATAACSSVVTWARLVHKTNNG
jgi:hypothetical protein